MADRMYKVYYDTEYEPPMYGIACADGTIVHRISTDYQEVSGLVDLCCEEALDPCHLRDVAHDFCLR